MVEKRCGVAFKYHFLIKLSKVSLVSWAVWQQFSRERFLRTKRILMRRICVDQVDVLRIDFELVRFK